MQENEFEKQVQQKMEELKLTPSDAVWQKIEPQIKKERRHKWVLVLWPMLLTGFLYGGYVFINRKDSNQKNGKQFTQEPKETDKQNKTAQQHITIPHTIKKEGQAEQITEQTSNPKKHTQEERKMYTPLKAKQNKATRILQPAPERKPIDIITNEVAINNRVKTEIKNSEPEQNAINKNAEPEKNLSEQTDPVIKHQKDSVQHIESNNKENIITAENKKVQKSRPEWKLGVSFSIGSSAMANNFLGSLVGNGQKSAGAQSLPPGNNISGLTPRPSLIKASLGFIAGISAEKNISGKIKFLTGINYKSFNTTNTTGTDSSTYYRADMNMNVFRNLYRYVEIPVSIKFNIADLKKARMQWSAGVSVSQLIRAKALQFNESSGYYYHDNSLFNKTQVGFHTSFDVEILLQQKRSLVIGPYYAYNISKVAPKGYNKQHFSFTGLRAHYFFMKK